MILSLGSISVDVELRVDRWPPDAGLVAGLDLLRVPGGKAANVAVFASRLDTSARLFGSVGDDDLAEEALG